VAGTQVRVDGGEAPQLGEVGCAPGTVVEVSDLFFNVPARLKFLKSTATESAHIASACVRAVLGHPKVALTLRSEGRVLRELLPARDLVERAHAVLPNEELVAIDSDAEGVRVRAALAPPERARSGSAGLHLLVNGRPVRDPALARSVLYAYGSVIPPGRYPIGVVAVEVEPERVDVNVHPQKTEVRFADARVVYDTVTRLLARGLGTSAWRGPQRAASYWDARLPAGPALDRVAEASATSHGEAGQPDPWGLAPEAAGEAPRSTEGELLERPGRFGGLRVLGQVRRMLLVCEGDDALHVIDQHAADERIRFDAVRRAYRSREVARQRLLFPERVEVSEAEADLVDRHADELGRAGIEHTRLGPTTVAVHAVPALLSRAKPERLLRDVLDEAGRHGARAFGDAVDMALATMACHGALRAGDELSLEEAAALLQNLDSVEDFAGHCPHGRPVVLKIPLDAIERRLGR
jgi:DNA mismatch repair protein MutL